MDRGAVPPGSVVAPSRSRYPRGEVVVPWLAATPHASGTHTRRDLNTSGPLHNNNKKAAHHTSCRAAVVCFILRCRRRPLPPSHREPTREVPMRLPSLSETHYTRTAAPSPQGRWTPPQPGRVCAAKYYFFVLRIARGEKVSDLQIVEKRAVLRECKIRRERTRRKTQRRWVVCI